MKSRTLFTVSSMALVMGGLFVLSEMIFAPAQAAHELDGRDIVKGKSLYDENCAACHGANLEGQENWQSRDENGVAPAPPHDEAGHTWHHDNQLLFFYTKLGGQKLLEARGMANLNSGMPGFEGVMSDEDIWDTLAYIRSTWPKRVQEIQDARNPPHD